MVFWSTVDISSPRHVEHVHSANRHFAAIICTDRRFDEGLCDMTIFRAAITAVVGLFGQAVGSDRPAAEDGSTASPAAPDAAVAQAADADAIPLAWLADKVSVAQAEADNPGVVDERITRFPELGKPFGGLNRKWEALKAQMRSGDELWTFSSPADSWKNLAGRAGIALVRDGTVIATLVTILN